MEGWTVREEMRKTVLARERRAKWNGERASGSARNGGYRDGTSEHRLEDISIVAKLAREDRCRRCAEAGEV